jgi:hypothetical protein
MVTAGMVHSLLAFVGTRAGRRLKELQTVCQCRHAHPFIKSSQIWSNAQSIIALRFGVGSIPLPLEDPKCAAYW